MSKRLRVAFAAAEVSPFCMTGGLGEVSAALPGALQDQGLDVAVFLPLYRQVRKKVADMGGQFQDTGTRVGVWMGGHRIEGRFLRIVHDSVRVPHFAFDCLALFDREGLYGHQDDAARFSTFCRGVLSLSPQLMGGAPHVVSCHDWHTALIPLYLEGPYRALLPKTASVLTIHNLGYQGVFPAHELATIGLGPEHYSMERLEFFGRLNFLKAGIASADAITTVSPRYAEEIRTPEFGERLEGVLQAHSKRLMGILNGIDTQAWDPSQDAHIAAPYSAEDLAGKQACRRELLEMARMDPDDPRPVFGLLSRLASQKGVDLLAELTPYLATRGVRLVVLGKGEPALEQWFLQLERQLRNHVRVELAYEARLAHVLQAGADAMVMPSRYEPCGLTQMCSMRYGTLPIVRAVGGLRDTVIEWSPRTVADGTATGFSFQHDTVEGLQWACDRALDVYYTQPDIWKRMQLAGMAQDFSWARSARRYAEVFRWAARRR